METIKIHGRPFIIKIDDKKIITGNAAASHFAEKMTGVKQHSIDFVSCYGANGGAFSNAQMLSNATKSIVKGYYGKVDIIKVNQFGDHYKTFRPQGAFKARICSIGNSILGTLHKPAFQVYRHIIR